MTRRSKRELEHAIEQLGGARPSREPRLLEEYHRDDVARFVRSVARDLLRIRYRDPEVANTTALDRADTFLETVREQYDIPTDRDEDVRRALEDVTAESRHRTPTDVFAMAPVAVAKHADVTASTGEDLTALVDADRDRTAERLLVRRAYEWLADEGGRQVEAPA